MDPRAPAPTAAAARWLLPAGAIALGLPAIILRLAEPDLPVLLETGLFGLGILSAAFLLGAAAEASQHDIPKALGIAVLAFVAVLPEYAVDLVFAWRAADDPEQGQFAVANMTGGNRLLVGVGWPMVLLVFYLRRNGLHLALPRSISLEIAVLGVATVYSFVIPLKGTITLIDTLIFCSLLAYYLVRSARSPKEAPLAGGPAEMVAQLTPWRRRTVVALLFAYAAIAIIAAAEPFADGLIATGSKLGVDEFLLVQWVAPLASESPEFFVAAYLVWRGAAASGMTALISSKVNQWTLLIGSIPVAFAVSGGRLAAFPLDGRQSDEIFLTAAQSLFAVLVIVDRRFSAREAGILFVLFAAQFLLTDSSVRIGFAIVYLVLAALLLVRRRRLVRDTLRDQVRPPPRATVEPEVR